ISLCPELRLTYGQLRQLVQCELLQLQSTDYGSLLTTGNEDLTVKENILNEFRLLPVLSVCPVPAHLRELALGMLQ
uniref:Uncharacterized protein n=1 Tax=Oncorhynchus kisutch TaxID=8019 RepID=A0A8C7I6C4_ONCKI